MSQRQPFDLESLYASGTPGPRRSLMGRPARYEFAIAYADPDSLPLQGLARGLEEALQQEGRDLALYPPSLGHAGTRELLTEKLHADRGIRADPDTIMLTSGSMQAINLVLELLVDPGDYIFTEEFTYLGTLRSMRRYRARVVGVPCDAQGMLPDALEQAVKQARAAGGRPKLVYTIPTFNNPLGTEMPLERRRALVEIAHRHGLAIMEDDCYVDLRFSGENIPAVRSLEGSEELTFYVGSFSKIVAPGVRLGWLVAPAGAIPRLQALKLDAGTNALASMAVTYYLRREMREHIDLLRRVLRERRDAMLSAVGEHMGPAVAVSRPRGGMYLWLRFPPGVDLNAPLQRALEAGVSYLPGDLFSPEGRGANCMRLCFGYNRPEEIREGIALLAEVLAGEGALPPE